MTGDSLRRSLSIHEAGHCAAAWMLGHKVKSVHLGDGRTGGVELARAPGWPSAAALEARCAILLAGSDAERTWCCENPDAPADWLQRVTEGRRHDLDRARAVAFGACGSDVALAKTYLGCVRDQVLDLTGRNSAGEGDPEFWRLTSALAGVLRKEHILTGKEAMRVLERVP